MSHGFAVSRVNPCKEENFEQERMEQVDSVWFIGMEQVDSVWFIVMEQVDSVWFIVTGNYAIYSYRYPSFNDGDTFWEMRH
jgi:hypothetical protein